MNASIATPSLRELMNMGVVAAAEHSSISRSEGLGRHLVTVINLTKEAAAEFGIGAVVHLGNNPDKTAATQAAIGRLRSVMSKYANGRAVTPLDAVSCEKGSEVAAKKLASVLTKGGV